MPGELNFVRIEMLLTTCSVTHTLIPLLHMNIYISALLYQYFAQNGNVHKRFRTANEVAMVYLKISTGESVPGKSLLKPFS